MMPAHHLHSCPLSTAPQTFHPERSLATSKANRQTQSKDPAPVGDTAGDGTISPFGAWVALILAGLALVATPSLGQVYRRFPGTKSELVSPDGRYILQSVDHDEEPYHSIVLKNETSGKTRKICDYERRVSVVWSADSSHFALNNYAGSDYTETNILAVDETVPKIDVQNEILRHDRLLRERVTLVGWGHDYFGVVRWLDPERVVVHHWGHNDDPPLGDFCVCYVYRLGGSVRKCLHQPRASYLEGLCWKTTP
jgi:hypothetical protein